MPKELEVKPDIAVQKTYYIGCKPYSYGYTLCYREDTKELINVTWYEGYDEEAKEIRVSDRDIIAILIIMDRYGFTLKGMKPVLTSPSNVEKGEE